jgi:pyruvate kinase
MAMAKSIVLTMTTKPKTAYDVRRYLTLVQVIAASGSDEAIRQLCELWGVAVVEDRSEPPYRGQYYLNIWGTLRALAQHVIEYHQEDTTI